MICCLNSALFPFLHHHCQSPTFIWLWSLYNHPSGSSISPLASLSPLGLSTQYWSVISSRTHALTHLILHLPILILNNTCNSIYSDSLATRPSLLPFRQQLWFNTAFCAWLFSVDLEVWKLLLWLWFIDSPNSYVLNISTTPFNKTETWLN